MLACANSGAISGTKPLQLDPVAGERPRLGGRVAADDGEARVGPGASDLRPDVPKQPEQRLGVRRVVEPSREEHDRVARRRVQPQRGGVDAVRDDLGIESEPRAQCPGVDLRHRHEELVAGQMRAS